MTERSVTIWLNPSEIGYVMQSAKKAAVGGWSNVRSGKGRRDNLLDDQVTGMLGEYAGNLYIFGEPSRFYIERLSCDINPAIGDGGSDILGSNIDFKTSRLMPDSRPENYNLLVRQKERHRGWVYFLLLLHPNGNDREINAKEPIALQIMGWAADDQLPASAEVGGPFDGAYRLSVSQLTPPPPIMWHWRKYKGV